LQGQLQPLIQIYGEMVTHKFRSKKKEASAYKEFVDSTLSGYATYVSNCINSVVRWEREEQKKRNESESSEKTKAEPKVDHKKKNRDPETAKIQELEDNGKQRQPKLIDENFRRICKIYIGHSVGAFRVYKY